MRMLRPFQVLKFIRDKQVTNVYQLDGLINLGISSDIEFLSDYLACLKKLNLIRGNVRGNFVPTNKFGLLGRVLGISLTKLEKYTEDSVICDPFFGVPLKRSDESDIFMVMPFLKELKQVYDDHIRKVAINLNLTIARGDDFFTADSI